MSLSLSPLFISLFSSSVRLFLSCFSCSLSILIFHLQSFNFLFPPSLYFTVSLSIYSLRLSLSSLPLSLSQLILQPNFVPRQKTTRGYLCFGASYTFIFYAFIYPIFCTWYFIEFFNISYAKMLFTIFTIFIIVSFNKFHTEY